MGAVPFTAFGEGEDFAEATDGVGVAGVEGEEGVIDDAFVFTGEALSDEEFEFGDIEVEHAGEEAEHEDVFTFIAGGSADGFDGEVGDGDTDVAVVFLPFRFGFHVVGIVEDDAAFAEGIDMAFVGVLVEGDEEVGFIAGAEDFAGAEADLEDGWAAGDGGRDGHEGHDLLFRASGEACQEAADGLDAVLGITGDPDDRFFNGGGGATRARFGGG
ncbi:MAG: hypothetical protein RI897_3056 [Verrucomicrobiota bacterium]